MVEMHSGCIPTTQSLKKCFANTKVCKGLGRPAEEVAAAAAKPALLTDSHGDDDAAADDDGCAL